METEEIVIVTEEMKTEEEILVAEVMVTEIVETSEMIEMVTKIIEDLVLIETNAGIQEIIKKSLEIKEEEILETKVIKKIVMSVLVEEEMIETMPELQISPKIAVVEIEIEAEDTVLTLAMVIDTILVTAILEEVTVAVMTNVKKIDNGNVKVTVPVEHHQLPSTRIDT